MKIQISHSLEETQKIAHDWLAEIEVQAKNADKATVVGLSGHLGAGKTAFVKAVAKELGITEEITSPTFVIMKLYKTDRFGNNVQFKQSNQVSQSKSASEQNLSINKRFTQLIHIDAYRLESADEMKVLALDTLIDDPNNLIMAEWPENVGMKTDFKINMKVIEDGVVEVVVE